MRRVDGFTLIETVVALLIVALGMTAVFMQVGQFARSSILMQDKTLASWIGSNVVTELSLETSWPETGDSEEEIAYANRVWHVTIAITETEVENLRRADVSVSLADRPDRVIHTVSGLIEPPVPQNFPPVNWISVGRGGRGPRG
jgi:general secretion pathway protein I